MQIACFKHLHIEWCWETREQPYLLLPSSHWSPPVPFAGTPWEIPCINSPCLTHNKGNEIQGLMCANGPWDPLEGSECAMVQTDVHQPGAREMSSGELNLKSLRMQQRDYFQGEEVWGGCSLVSLSLPWTAAHACKAQDIPLKDKDGCNKGPVGVYRRGFHPLKICLGASWTHGSPSCQQALCCWEPKSFWYIPYVKCR